MNIQSLFSTPQRAAILTYVLEDPEHISRVSDAARELKIAKGLLSSFFRLLEERRIVKIKGKGIVPDLSNPMTRVLKVIINLENIDVRPFLQLRPTGIGLYGSWARGTNNPQSDVDIWITLDKTPSQKDLAAAQHAVSQKVGADVQLLILDPQRLQTVRKDPTFYPAIVYSTLLLYGESLEATD